MVKQGVLAVGPVLPSFYTAWKFSSELSLKDIQEKYSTDHSVVLSSAQSSKEKAIATPPISNDVLDKALSDYKNHIDSKSKSKKQKE